VQVATQLLLVLSELHSHSKVDNYNKLLSKLYAK
jgi:hypothetical protein